MQEFKRFVSRLALFTIALMAAMAEGGLYESAIEEVFRLGLIAEGATEDYANCVVDMLKLTGASDDLFKIRNYWNMDKLADKLEFKARFADFICANGGIPFLYFIGFLFLAIFTCCCCCCCCKQCHSEKTPAIVQMTRPAVYSDPTLRYERMDKV